MVFMPKKMGHAVTQSNAKLIMAAVAKTLTALSNVMVIPVSARMASISSMVSAYQFATKISVQPVTITVTMTPLVQMNARVIL